MNDDVDAPRRGRLGTVLLVAGVFLFGGLVGFALRGGGEPAPANAGPESGKILFWTCSMHPEVHAAGPGRCPKCGMALVPVYESGAGTASGKSEIALSPEAAKLAEIRTSPVERRAVDAELRLTGTVTYDERNVRQIAARYGGRIEELHANFTGAAVRAGEPLAEIYSPELLSAQEELLQAAKAAGRAGAGSGEYLKGLDAKTLDAARQKLLLLGFGEEQVRDIEKAGKVSERLAILSPIAGTVVKKMVNEGDYVAVGAPLFTVADLSKVWMMLDAYEADLPLVAAGQEATVSADAFPGETFRGKVVFIDPTLSPETRTARLRLEVENPGGRLKPETFGYGVIHRRLGGDGHPPLVVPASAPLITGTRAVAYVEVPGRGRPTYEGREVRLGPRAGDWYVVLAGLAEGERVVTRGNFKLDAELQIRGRGSLMNPTDRTEPADPTGRRAKKPQQTCPVMGGKIDRNVFLDYQGQRVYFCCDGCPQAFLKDPGKYLAKLRELGEEPEPAPAPAPAPAAPAPAAPGGHHH